MAFKMKNAGGTFKSMGSSAMKTGDHSEATGHKHGISKTLKDKPPNVRGISKTLKDKTEYDPRVETKKEVDKANALEDKNNDAAARKEYMEMMKAKKSPLNDRGHGRGNHSSNHTRQEKIDKNNPIGAKRKGSDREKETKRKYEAKKGAASEAMNNLHESYMKQGDKSAKEMGGKDRREQKGLQRKATRAHRQERRTKQVADHVESKKHAYQDKPTKPSAKKPKPKKQGGTISAKKTLLGKVKFTHDLGSGRKKESEENKIQRKADTKEWREDKKDYRKDKASYRKGKGLRGAINARRLDKKDMFGNKKGIYE
tara:strand:+ start:643 stop:1581 length:939 start_codon:yes stop_codon:yes gene_type:complete